MSIDSPDTYKLIGLDQMEASVVRRRLHHWSNSDEEAIRPLIVALQQMGCLPNARIVAPRWETNVYPLYYWASHKLGSKTPYTHVFESLPTARVAIPFGELLTFVRRMVDSEIDILVEDHGYFIFIEAKETAPNRKTVFQDRGGLRQLVRQYVQGRILERLIGKVFVLATIGANTGEPTELAKFSPAELALLQLVSDAVEPIRVVDLSWPTN